jgi:hypothetical protein
MAQPAVDPLDALAAEHGAIMAPPGAFNPPRLAPVRPKGSSAPQVDPLDELARESGAIVPDFEASNLTDERGEAVVDPNAHPIAMKVLQALGLDKERALAHIAGDLATGAVKGAGQTAANLGRLIHKVPGVSAAVDELYGTPGLSGHSFDEADKVLEPANAAERVGKVGEQIAEVAIPSRMVSSAAGAVATRLAPRLAPIVGETAASVIPRAVVEGAGTAALTAAQGGDPRVGAVIGGAIPVVGKAIQSVAPVLRESAAKKVVQALGPTKERYKAMAEKLTPEILRRGLGGSRESLVAKAADTLETVGGQIDETIAQFADRPIGVAPVIEALEKAKGAYQTVREEPLKAAIQKGYVTFTNEGRAVASKPGVRILGDSVEIPIIFDARPINQLTKLQGVLEELGPEARTDHLIALRRAWDDVVAQAGGFSHRAPGAIGLPLKEQSEAWAKREATSAIRKVLAEEVPELAVLNKEYSFWKGIDDVLTQTLKRTQPQGPGLLKQVAEVGGQLAGGVAGSTHGPAGAVGGAFAMGKAVKLAEQAFASPRWKFVNAKLKDRLADAITTGNLSETTSLLAHISAVEAGKVPGSAKP